MSLLDFVALSLLPIRQWPLVFESLRAGGSLTDLLAAHAEEIASTPLYSRAAAAVEAASRAALDPLPWFDPEYPAPLAAIIDPPPVLWLRGKRGALRLPAVAIVGSRAGSPYALAVAERLAADLAERGVVIVSGLARGVDSAAHRGALSVGGTTVAVLGCGADMVYPAEHAILARDIAQSGAVLSELVPGTPPKPYLFPQRNRIISGLSRAVVVIEAGEKSGSLITARCALEQGREVLAVPGNVLNGRNRGGHALLRDGARIVETADDILEELGSSAPALQDATCPADAASGSAAEEVIRDPVLAALAPGEACDLDELSQRTGWSPGRLLPRLFDLELQGLVRRVGGGRFLRFDRSC